MPRSEAQRAADKKYAEKIKDKHKHFGVNLTVEEYDRISAIIDKSGMSKADFLRWAVDKLKEKQ